ncbi:MAG: Flp family type IVb pilin [Planctomycetia bacterium]|nr:Flp family type IVb pilin [Planctomycetia bacterium]
MSEFLFNQSEKAKNAVRKFLTGKEEGAALVEYGLLVALIAIASITAIIATGTGATALFTNVGSRLTPAGS